MIFNGLVLVVSPLISIMKVLISVTYSNKKDQVDYLVTKDVPVAVFGDFLGNLIMRKSTLQ